MIVQFLELHRLPDGRLYHIDQVAVVDDETARDLVRRNIAREYKSEKPAEPPDPDA